MLEEYIRTGDGKEYVNVNCVREALGIGKDSESDIFEWIAFLKKSNERSHSEMHKARDEKHEFEKKIREALGIVDEYADLIGLVRKLKEERDQLKEKCDGLTADLELTHRLYKENHDFVDKVCEAVDIPRPYFESGYTNAAKLIAEIKRERDELKEKYDKLKKRTNAAYGVSCGYSGNKAPAFLCDIISYSWEFSPINACTLGAGPSYRVRDDSIRVELNLTPTANYKGSFDLEDLKKYIQEYGREKKLGIIESVDYQNAKVARAELAYLYKQVLGKEKLDRDLSPHEVMKAILDAVKKLRDAQFASDQCLRSVYMHIYEGTGYKVSDLYAAPDKIAEWIITRYDSTKTLGHMKTVCDINDFIDELCDKYNVVQPARSKTTRERIEYIFSALTDYRNMADSNFNKAVAFRREISAVEVSRAELRAKIREIYRSVVDVEWEENLSYTSALNDINEEYKRVVHNFEERTADWSKAQQELDRYARFRSNICTALCLGGETSDADILNAIAEDSKESNKLTVFRNDVAKAIGLPYIDINSDIINRVVDIKEHHDKLCKDYTELRKAIWEAIGKKTETQPGDNESLVREVQTLVYGNKWLREFRDSIAKAMGMDYPTTNTFIVKRVEDIYKDRADAYNMVVKLNDNITELEEAKEDLQQSVKGWTNRCISLADTHSEMQAFRRNAIEDLKSRGFCFRPEENETLPEIYDKLLKRYDWTYGEYKEQYRLRQCWHTRWESEHERANGVQKALDREREKCRVKDISLETAKKQYEKVCSNLETAECALNGMKSKVRELREEKTKVISAIGQDIWDDCVK